LTEQKLKQIQTSTDKGILLRMNRSIQVEGAFGVLKQDYGFGGFLTRGKTNNETSRTHYRRDRALDDIKQGKHKLYSSAAPDVHDGAALLPPYPG
jgi:hypothetical protein